MSDSEIYCLTPPSILNPRGYKNGESYQNAKVIYLDDSFELPSHDKPEN